MKKYSINFYVDRDDHEIELEIIGTISPYVRAKTNCLPEHAYPGEESTVEIHSITCRGDLWRGELTPAELEAVEEIFIEAAMEDSYDDVEQDDFLD